MASRPCLKYSYLTFDSVCIKAEINAELSVITWQILDQFYNFRFYSVTKPIYMTTRLPGVDHAWPDLKGLTSTT